MTRRMTITNPDADVQVMATITQKQRGDLQTLAFSKEHTTVKALVRSLIIDYLNREENANVLKVLSDLSTGLSV